MLLCALCLRGGIFRGVLLAAFLLALALPALALVTEKPAIEYLAKNLYFPRPEMPEADAYQPKEGCPKGVRLARLTLTSAAEEKFILAALKGYARGMGADCLCIAEKEKETKTDVSVGHPPEGVGSGLKIGSGPRVVEKTAILTTVEAFALRTKAAASEAKSPAMLEGESQAAVERAWTLANPEPEYAPSGANAQAVKAAFEQALAASDARFLAERNLAAMPQDAPPDGDVWMFRERQMFRKKEASRVAEEAYAFLPKELRRKEGVKEKLKFWKK